VGVNLGIAYAMQLPDPKKLLEGTGKLHRHVKLKSKSDLETAASVGKREVRLGWT
jgi:hypothetical protein